MTLQPIYQVKLFNLSLVLINYLDSTFQGTYNGKKYHQDDTDEVIKRSLEHGVDRMLFAVTQVIMI